ncbi:hypothetical protein DMN91_004161 [Ooceraea biroi]|uniref:Uncharacterized protein n=1 Tax=Ooceraea biroi TaxID=2015173 RepID=A0A3L8DUU9_OOCBI|nr:hypothetical protein DMN91_004161 [Ooceraea biroi]
MVAAKNRNIVNVIRQSQESERTVGKDAETQNEENSTGKEKLQLRSDLTLGMVVDMTKQAEQVKVQTQKLTEATQPISVNKIDTRKSKKSDFWKKKTENIHQHDKDKKKKGKITQDLSGSCGRCGGESHLYKEYPAIKTTCHKCKKVGHYARVCRSSATDITFKADTGASITCISDVTFYDMFFNVKLQKSQKRLLNANKGEMKTLEFFRKPVQYKHRSWSTDIYVVRGLGQALLDRDTCEKLRIINRIGAVAKSEAPTSFDPRTKYPQLFEGLGRFKTPYTIQEDGDIGETLETCVAAYVQMVTDHMPLSDQKLSEIVELQNNDPICVKLKQFSKQGWPDKDKIPSDIKDYWQERNDIAVEDGLLTKGSRIIISKKLRHYILDRIHDGHQGIAKCRAYPEVKQLRTLKKSEIILHLKSLFARHGIPEVVYSDNGTHFGPLLKSAFSLFAKQWGFSHRTSSPKFPQSNGFIEAGVKIIKRSLKKSGDVYETLLNYRATPQSNGFSPAELLMGRRLRTSVPMTSSLLNPSTPDPQQLTEKEKNASRLRSVTMIADTAHGNWKSYSQGPQSGLPI